MVRAYLDHASTSPLRPAAAAAMQAWLQDAAGADPGRLHVEGQAARVALESAREALAGAFGARPREVVLTSGGTEACAAAVWGAAERGGHQVVARVEHSAVRLAAERLGPVTWVGCDGLGRVDPDEVLGALRPDTSCVHVQWANHEVGTLQPVEEVVRRCRERGVLVHVDACQVLGRLPVGFSALGADLVSLSAHKAGGPAGVGALLVRRGLRVRPLLVGGEQERARRAGLENVLGAVGWAAAMADCDVHVEGGHQRRLTRRVLDAVAGLDGVVAYGDTSEAGRSPHLVCLGIEGIEPQAVLLGLDQAGVAVHSGSACASEDLLPSPVLEAMGVDAARSLRVSVGWSSTDADVDALLAALPPVLARLRALRPA